MSDQEKDPKPVRERKQYEKPELDRWGKLRDLTHGGGGTKNEPANKRRTRF